MVFHNIHYVIGMRQLQDMQVMQEVHTLKIIRS